MERLRVFRRGSKCVRIISLFGTLDRRGIDRRPSHIVDRVGNRQPLGDRIDLALQVVGGKSRIDETRRIDKQILVVLILRYLRPMYLLKRFGRRADADHDSIDDGPNRMAKGHLSKTRWRQIHFDRRSDGPAVGMPEHDDALQGIP